MPAVEIFEACCSGQGVDRAGRRVEGSDPLARTAPHLPTNAAWASVLRAIASSVAPNLTVARLAAFSRLSPSRTISLALRPDEPNLFFAQPLVGRMAHVARNHPDYYSHHF